MNVALQLPWTTERFLDWASAQEGRFEFDSIRPVAMTGGSGRHSRITGNIHAALRARLRGGPCSYYGPDLGVQAGESVRYPDALVTCTPFDETARLAPDVRVVFEVLSPTSERTDRITKVAEYRRIPTLLRYVLVETRFAALTILHRSAGTDPWTELPLGNNEVLDIPEAGVSVPVAELYENVAFGPESIA